MRKTNHLNDPLMQNKSPQNQADLLILIEHIKIQKRIQEQELATCAKNFFLTLNPVSFIKDSVHSLVSDPDVTYDLANAGAQMGTNIVIDMVLGRYRSVKGFVGSVVLEKIFQPYISQYVSNLFGKRRRKDP